MFHNSSTAPGPSDAIASPPAAISPAPAGRMFWLFVGLPLVMLLAWLTLMRLGEKDKIGVRDLAQEWSSAKNFFAGRPIYLPLRESLPIYLGPEAKSVFAINAHPPAAVLLTLPLGRLSYPDAWYRWGVFSLVVVAISGWLLLGPAGLHWEWEFWIPVACWILASNALKEQLLQGQLTAVILLLCALAWVTDRRGWQGWCGACVGLAAAIKLFPAFVLVYLVAQRRWKAVLAAGLTLVGVNLIALLVLGSDAFADYLFQSLPSLDTFRTGWLNSSLNGFFSKLFISRGGSVVPLWENRPLGQGLYAGGSVLVTAFVFLASRLARDERRRDVAFAACLIGMLLVCPLTWDHYFLLLACPGLLLWHAARGQTVMKVSLLALLAILTLARPGWIFALTVPGDGEFAALAGGEPSLALPIHCLTGLALLFYALLLLFVATLVISRTGAAP